jgi:putative methionine-R-sulfoxide reductase with GAF domain
MHYQQMTTAHANPADQSDSGVEFPRLERHSAEALMKGIVSTLHQKLTRYNWMDFYMLEKEADRDLLILGPF